MAVLGVTLLGILATAYGAVALMCKGPSPTARDMFVTTMMETSAAKFVPRLFLSGAEIEAILHKNTVIEGETNTEAVEEFVPRNEEVPKDTIELLDVYGPTFRGKMMIVHDPSRSEVATRDRYGAVLLLAIDGRQTHSLGASFKDCIDVMMEYGAINAANLDGGSSTMMVYKGETVNSCASMYGSRRLPTAIIVE